MWLNRFNNHSQIYTHSSKYGICRGQKWVGEYNVGGVRITTIDHTVACITQKGRVVLLHDNGLIRPLYIPISHLLEMAKILIPVFFKPFIQPDGTVHIQIIRDLSYKENVWTDDKECQVMGELKNEYIEREVKQITYDQLFDMYS